MDFSGIAKGYIVDQAAEFLKKRGWKNFLVDAGGDMMISGRNSEGEKWRIAVEGVPEEKLMLEISGKGIATSGISRKKWQINGKKFHHLVNPKDPNNFSYELRTVSVIAQKYRKRRRTGQNAGSDGKRKGDGIRKRKQNCRHIFGLQRECFCFSGSEEIYFSLDIEC